MGVRDVASMGGMETTKSAEPSAKIGYYAGAAAAALTTTRGLAERYSISPRQVQKFVESGVFPTVRMGRRCLRFDVAECDAAIELFKVRAASTGRAGRRASR